MLEDPFEIMCDNCREVLYRGMEIKYARDILKNMGFKCKNCGAQLSTTEFIIEVSSL